MALFKFAEILNFRVEIRIDLAISLTFLVDLAFDFDCLSLAVTFLCERFMFLLVLL